MPRPFLPRGRSRSSFDRIVRVWALEGDGAERLAILCDEDPDVAANLAAATDLLVRYLKQDRIADVVRRPAPGTDGVTLLDLLLEGDSERVLQVCQDMFRFDEVYD